MIPKECKRLAEVDFPIAEVSRHAVRDKSTPPGHPSTLHLWWARRPLASSRAVLLALLLPDPCDPHCPAGFKAQARTVLLALGARASAWESIVKTDEGLRQVMLKFIADFADWSNAANDTYLETSRGLVQAAYPDQTPLVVDPFAGGGSIPLEALRLGCETFASDLNPVACLLLKTLLEDIPRHGPGLADELRRVVAEVKRQAEQELADLYPKDPDGSTPIAYLWARTVRCEAPNCGIEIPIYRSGWLSKKGAKRATLFRESDKGNCVALLNESATPGLPVKFRIARGEGRDNAVKESIPLPGTKAGGSNSNVICPSCKSILPGTKKNPRVAEQLARQRGGANAIFDEHGQRTGGAMLLAVVTIKPSQPGRHFRLPTEADYAAVHKAQKRLATMVSEWEHSSKENIFPLPDEPTPVGGKSRSKAGGSAFNIYRYGMTQWKDLFTARQNVALEKLARLTASLPHGLQQTMTALLIGKMADGNNSLSRWRNDSESSEALFARQAIPIVWDFCESTPASSARGAFLSGVEAACKVVDRMRVAADGSTQQADATDHPLPDEAAGVWFTDPPYYDAIPYADLSDFFLVWLKRSLPNHSLVRNHLNPSDPLSPKRREVVQDNTKLYEGQPKTSAWFEEKMGQAFAEGRRVLSDNGIGSVVFAHKTTEGWEALLSGIVHGGWTITGSWPIATELETRLRARQSAALATSVHLICRPRSENAPVGEWADVLRELPVRVGDWMQRLQKEGIRGADLVFACIGPALEIYSRYRAVETPEGRKVELPEYLERVWEVVAREALEQVLGTAEAQARNGTAGALEEDARMTALFLWTLQSTADDVSPSNGAGDEEEETDEDDEAPARRPSGFSLPYDVARRFAQPLGIHMEEWENRIINTAKGVVRLRPVADRARELFGEAGADNMADEIESNAASSGQLSLFPDEAPTIRGRTSRGRRAAVAAVDDTENRRNATTLDRIHAAMLLQASGRTEALRNLIRAEQDRGPDFLRLSNALSALYPRGSEEKRLLDGMLLATPR